jgi:Mitochondrial K+-H+ exchange-related
VLDAATGESPGQAVKIYLLLIDHARFFFYSDESEALNDRDHSDEPSSTRRSGVRGWFLAKYDEFRSAWQHADSGALHWMRQSWDWLHSWAHPDEAMLARMWSARRVDLYHPASRRGDEVLTIWKDYLRQQWRRHLVWLVVNAVIAPISVLLAILPGPNLIGYWFAYRAVHHSMVAWGILRVQRSTFPTEVYPIDALDLPVEKGKDGKHIHAALAGLGTGLDTHMAWHGSVCATPADSNSTVVPAATGFEPAESQSEMSKDG